MKRSQVERIQVDIQFVGHALVIIVSLHANQLLYLINIF